MREREFYNWLINIDDLQPNTANSRLNNCIRVCEYEGDLDVHYDRDRCQRLLNRLIYSINDARNNYAPRHSIPINGNIYTGTSTLKAAVNKYVNFRNSERVANPIFNRNNQVLHRNNHNLRFYNDIFINHSGRRYLISNDWYHRTERANRNMFKRWIVDKASILSNIIRIF